MVVSVLITLLGQQQLEWPKPEGERLDQVTAVRGPSSLDLDWSDAEDRMHGTVRPLDPIAERPVELSVMVGTFQGPEFDGPVTMTMRCADWQETRTVRRAKGERAWFVSFVPLSAGECQVDLGFNTTRSKLLHLQLFVAEAPLSRAPWFVILGALLIAAFGLGVRAVFRKPEQA